MTEFLEKIYKKICSQFRLREFTFRFDIYNGTENQSVIYFEDVFQYEFINQGTTICVINEGLFIYPEYVGIQPSRITMEVRANEKDITVYKYRFQPVEYISQQVAEKNVPPFTEYITNTIVPVGSFTPATNEVTFNRLLVKSKLGIRHKS